MHRRIHTPRRNAMATTDSIQQLNRDAADRVLDEAQRNPQAYAGKFVGIANGQIVVVTDDLKELGLQLQRAEPDASKTCVVEPGLDVNQVDEIWEVH
jgi:hypothetical protein